MRLVEFSQGVSVTTKEMQNYLVFERADGTRFTLPVPEETIKALLPEVYKNKTETPAPPPVEALPEGDLPPDDLDLEHATQFGEAEEPPTFAPEPEEGPRSEEEVPSL
jgi:hypothetical protein